jgi:hypothetical protein
MAVGWFQGMLDDGAIWSQSGVDFIGMQSSKYNVAESYT